MDFIDVVDLLLSVYIHACAYIFDEFIHCKDLSLKVFAKIILLYKRKRHDRNYVTYFRPIIFNGKKDCVLLSENSVLLRIKETRNI